MIRKSTAIATAALVLSFLVHVVGIALTLPHVSARDTPDPPQAPVAVNQSFEDFADVQTHQPEPDLAETPEPPVETPPEPDTTEAPTSQALVASNNPQSVSAPDRGTAETTAPPAGEPVTAEAPDTSNPDADPGAERAERVEPDTSLTSPLGAGTEETALGTPEVAPAPSPPLLAPLPPSDVTAPADAEPPSPVSDSPAADVLAALPPDVLTPDESPLPVETETDAPDSTPPTGSVSSSVRPKTRPDTLANRSLGARDATATGIDGLRRPTEIIESPLSAYQRDGTNLFAGQRGGSRSGNAGPGGALGPGNSDVTNYAGEVLMHLNRVPPVAVSARGWARVVFRIEPDGSLAFVNILDANGPSDLEVAAKEHVRRGVPFPRPPGGQSRVLNFIYRIQ